MSLHRYFKISSKLPDPNGPLSKEVPSEAIKEANKSVESATKNIGTSECGGGKRGRGAYMKFTLYPCTDDIFFGTWPTMSLPLMMATAKRS